MASRDCIPKVRYTASFNLFLSTVILITATVLPGITAKPSVIGDRKTVLISACGPEEILLSASNPEYMFTFPHNDDDGYSRIARRSIYVKERVSASASANSGANGTKVTRALEHGRIPFYRCKWVITTDSDHSISAIFEFSSDFGFSLSAEDDEGYIVNCTTRRCLIESTTPAISLEFNTGDVDQQPATKFIAKLYSTYSDPGDREELVDWWLVLISSTALLAFVCSTYLFYMKRSLLLSRIFKLLNNAVSDSPSKTAQVKKKPAPNHDPAQPSTPARRQQRTSMCSNQGTTFEPMPTITEEDNEVMDSDSVSDAYSVKKSSMSLPQPPAIIRVA